MAEVDQRLVDVLINGLDPLLRRLAGLVITLLVLLAQHGQVVHQLIELFQQLLLDGIRLVPCRLDQFDFQGHICLDAGKIDLGGDTQRRDVQHLFGGWRPGRTDQVAVFDDQQVFLEFDLRVSHGDSSWNEQMPNRSRRRIRRCPRTRVPVSEANRPSYAGAARG